MADLNTLIGLSISMKKHPDSLKLENPLKDKLESYLKDEKNESPYILYKGYSLSLYNYFFEICFNFKVLFVAFVI